MQKSNVYYQLLSQHVSGIIMPIFRRTKTVCYCIRCTALVLLDVVGSGCGALRCRMRAVLASYNAAPHNLITSDIKLVFYSSTITMMHGPIYIRLVNILIGTE